MPHTAFDHRFPAEESQGRRQGHEMPVSRGVSLSRRRHGSSEGHIAHGPFSWNCLDVGNRLSAQETPKAAVSGEPGKTGG